MPRGGVEVCSTLSLTSVVEGGGCPTSRPGRFTSGKDPVPIGDWVGIRAGLEWREKFRPTGIRSPDRPARKE